MIPPKGFPKGLLKMILFKSFVEGVGDGSLPGGSNT
jgi:hypothetical protein